MHFAESVIAGATAGVVVEAALYPIDTIKTRLQVSWFNGSVFHYCRNFILKWILLSYFQTGCNFWHNYFMFYLQDEFLLWISVTKFPKFTVIIVGSSWWRKNHFKGSLFWTGWKPYWCFAVSIQLKSFVFLGFSCMKTKVHIL